MNSGPQSSSFSVAVALAEDASDQEEKDERLERLMGVVVLNANPYQYTLFICIFLKSYFNVAKRIDCH